MQKMNRAELERILRNLYPILGMEPHSRGVKKKFLKEINKQEREGDIQIPCVLRRLERTITRIREKYPGIKPQEDESLPEMGGMPIEEGIRVSLGQIGLALRGIGSSLGQIGLALRGIGSSLGQIGKSLSYPNDYFTRTVDCYESYLRAALSGRQEKGEDWRGKLDISGFVPSKKCLGACKGTCAISARANGPQMPWELFEGAIESPDIFLSREEAIWLGDGEPLIYPHLFEMVEKLIVECGCKVGFTTAGLLPQNRKRGIEFFNKLPSLGVYASALEIGLSFNLQFGCIQNKRDVGKYVGCVKETASALVESGAHFSAAVGLFPEVDELGTAAAYKKVRRRLERIYGFGGIDERRGIVKIGDAYDSGKGTITMGGECNRMLGRYTLAEDGSLATGCCGFGRGGSSVGNLTENSLEQMLELLRTHDRRFEAEILLGPGRKCLNHQRWKNGRFRAPKSNNPVIKLKREIRAGGMLQGGRKICR